ncbi:MAG: hypothetical protein WCF83_29570, partial [Pseudolabrys sp.]
AVGAYHGHKADRIVAEKNYGGEMVESTIKNVPPRCFAWVETLSPCLSNQGCPPDGVSLFG